MRIFLKILGFLFTVLLIFQWVMFWFLLSCDFEVNALIPEIKAASSFDIFTEVLLYICFGLVFLGIPVWDLISNSIDDHFPE